MADYSFEGGEKLKEILANLAKKADEERLLKVGFFAGSTESKDGVPTAYVAMCNEFGGTIPERTVQAHRTTIYRRVDKSGKFLLGGRFTNRSKSNFATEHDVPEHVIPEHTVPPRPFFRRMISSGEKHWGNDLGRHLTRFGMNSEKAMDYMGQQMVEELQESIQAQGYAPLKPSTVKSKGNDQTLIDSADMLNAVAYEVEK